MKTQAEIAKEIGIKMIPVIIKEELIDENEKLKKLIASNFGRLKNDPEKQRKVVVKYVELCGYKKGDNQFSMCDNRMSIDEIAKQLGTNKRSLQELLEIERKLTPEVKELLDTGIISKTSASKIWVKLSEQEQEELLNELGREKIEETQISPLRSVFF
ncbi:MAG: hypothetical protein VB084_13570 [Syntrophomonadaceae bacterium]|nr:hypothetical protein [Syntrophomonadaceae bacterium]